MFERVHHQRIATLLKSLDVTQLQNTQCFFGGGTAISLELGEYRESVDVDFLCASSDGYRELRGLIYHRGMSGLGREPLQLVREARADQYGVRAVVDVLGTPIRLEFVREARITLSGELHHELGVPMLSKVDLFAEKLLANADRQADASTMSRDIIDLGMMSARWGPIPQPSWAKARLAYGDTVDAAFAAAVARVSEPARLEQCMTSLGIESALATTVLSGLGRNQP